MTDQAEQGGDLAERIVAAFEVDFTDRRGLRQEWEQIDEDTLVEIRQTWTRIVRDELNTRPDQSLQHSDRSARPLEVIRTYMKPDGTLNLDRAALQELWDECQRVEDVYYERDKARATIAEMQRTQCADCVKIGKLEAVAEAAWMLLEGDDSSLHMRLFKMLYAHDSQRDNPVPPQANQQQEPIDPEYVESLARAYCEMRCILSRIGIVHEAVHYDYPNDEIPRLTSVILESNKVVKMVREMTGDKRNYEQISLEVKRHRDSQQDNPESETK